MKKSLKHLPKNKQEELQKVVLAIQKTCKDVEKIILFGSYARGDYKEAQDLKEGRRTGHISDYDILVVTQKKKSTDEFVSWNGAENLNLSAPARIIAHDIESLNINLAEGQYLFADIKKEGILLFDNRKHKLASKRKLKQSEKQRIAKDYFDHWFGSAEEFFVDYKNAIKRKSYKKAAFELHQAAEHSYKTILLVFTNYNPNEHYLRILGRMSEKHCEDLKNLFPKTTRKEKDRFKLLEYAYIGGRYDPDYRISKEDLEVLAKDVKELLRLTKKACEKEIQTKKKIN